MKALIKTINKRYTLRLDEVFTSKANTKILERLIPELLRLMEPRYTPTRKQLRDWLGALHRHQRGRYIQRKSGKLPADNRRIHENSRLNEVFFIYFH